MHTISDALYCAHCANSGRRDKDLAALRIGTIRSGRTWRCSRQGQIFVAVARDLVVAQDVTGPGYQHDTQDRLVLEAKERMKRRGLDSPDDGDALALTFTAPVRRKGPRLCAEFRGTEQREAPGEGRGTQGARHLRPPHASKDLSLLARDP